MCVGVVRKGMVEKIQNLKTTGWDQETFMRAMVLTCLIIPASLTETLLPCGLFHTHPE